MSFVPAPQRGWHRGCVALEGCRAGGGLPLVCLPWGSAGQDRAELLLLKDSRGGRATCNL